MNELKQKAKDLQGIIYKDYSHGSLGHIGDAQLPAVESFLSTFASEIKDKLVEKLNPNFGDLFHDEFDEIFSHYIAEQK